MEILNLSNGTLKDNENLKQGFCKKYKEVKIGSSKCQKCKFFNMNIHLKIEAKKLMFSLLKQPYVNTYNNRVESLKSLYTCFNNDKFLLPYKVQKLSKRARRNLI